MTLLDSSLLQELENLLIDHVYRDQWNKSLDGNSIPPDLIKSYIAHAKGLSRLFTSNRDSINTRYFRKAENRYAYVFYFHISSVMRAYHVINEMLRNQIWPKNAETFMDLGCGSGSSLWALGLHQKMSSFPIRQVYGIDQDQHMLKDAKKLWFEFMQKFHVAGPEMKTYKIDLMNIKKLETKEFQSKVDIVFCSNVLNEFSKMSQASKLTLFKVIALHVLKKDGMLVLIEPALSETTRNLMELRDLLLEHLPADIPVPCGHENPCPMLRNPKDWCHFSIEWDPPQMRRRIEKALNFTTGTLHYSYLVLRKKIPSQSISERTRHRVLSPALKSDKQYCVLLCSKDDVLALYFSKQDKVLMKIKRGDVLELGPYEEFVNSQQIYQKSIRLLPQSLPKII